MTVRHVSEPMASKFLPAFPTPWTRAFHKKHGRRHKSVQKFGENRLGNCGCQRELIERFGTLRLVSTFSVMTKQQLTATPLVMQEVVVRVRRGKFEISKDVTKGLSVVCAQSHGIDISYTLADALLRALLKKNRRW